MLQTTAPGIARQPGQACAGPATSPRRRSGYLPTLDGWRALAILGVLVAHWGGGFFPSGADEELLTIQGQLGVDLFFGISGFLITWRLLEEHNLTGRISLRGFYVRRAFRILPAAVTFLAVLAVLSVCGLSLVNLREGLSCLFFWRKYLSPGELGGWYTGHFWSLSVEEHFYLLWPGLLLLAGLRGGKWTAASLAVALALWRVIEYRKGWVEALLPGVGFFGRTDIRLDGLFWGAWTALVLARAQSGGEKWLTRFWASRPAPFLLAALLAACLVWQPPFRMVWEALLLAGILAATVSRPSIWLGALLESAPLRWLGRLSYSLYLWQQLFLVPWSRDAPLGILQRFPCNVLCVFACAMLSYYLIEKPVNRLGHRLARPTTPGRGP
jgi:peptidoglycan/LPS O-acetylase OafA/YrhL